MAESSTLRPNSTVISQVPTALSNCFLLSEVKEDSRHHNRLALKYKLNALAIGNLDKIEEYNLMDVAAHCQVRVDDEDTNEQLALNIIKYLQPAYEYRTDAELKIGKTQLKKLKKECYISTNGNRGDVMVSYGGSDVLYVEVHSGSTYDHTIRKTVYLLMECLRMLKAFGVMQPKMDAFVFPRKDCQRCVVRLSMRYVPEFVRFQYSFRCLPIEEISAKLTAAVQSNRRMCEKLTNEPQLDYVLWLTAEERQKWGTNLLNAKSNFGILLMNDDTCLKRPIFTESFNMLYSIAELQMNGKRLQYMANYEVAIPRVFIQYSKIRHEPLSYEEGKNCSRELVKKMTKVIRSIHTAGYMHRDLRLANICFDSNFEPILIGFDLSTIYIQHDVDVDMAKFADELIKCFENSQTAQADLFIQNYAKGLYDQSLLDISIVNSGRSSVQSVIIDRDVS